jgi:GNAT superfamily N-acetyltransferase
MAQWRARRSVGIGALIAFFVFGACMSAISAITLAFPKSPLEAMWRLNPEAHAGLAALGGWGILLMGVVSLACAASAAGLWTLAEWGRRLALFVLAVNLTGDLLGAMLRHDPRTLIGLPIGGLVIWYLSSAPVRRKFIEPRLRRALLTEVPSLNALIARSATELSRGYYTPAQTESLVTHVFGVDTQLLADGTYYVIEIDGRLAACGGWSGRRTLFGGDQAKGVSDPVLDPAKEAARIRAFFVHPFYARRGLGRRLLQHCEYEVRAAGFRRAELMATLPGVPLYRTLGYETLEPVTHPLPDGQVVEFVRMGRAL